MHTQRQPNPSGHTPNQKLVRRLPAPMLATLLLMLPALITPKASDTAAEWLCCGGILFFGLASASWWAATAPDFRAMVVRAASCGTAGALATIGALFLLNQRLPEVRTWIVAPLALATLAVVTALPAFLLTPKAPRRRPQQPPSAS